MREMVITKAGGPECLVPREVPDPTPGPGTLRVRVRAAGVNFADVLARQGLYPDAPALPCVVGYEVAGVVDACGAGVGAEWMGREVVALTRFGGYADTVVVPLAQAWPKPAALDFAAAAAVPVNYLTAWQLMVVMGALAADDTVLVHNAGGGVGLAAIDVARHRGARVIGTASTSKHDFLRARGLDLAIDYTREDWLPAVMSATGGRGVELVLDPLGGSHWKKSYRALRHTGRLGMFGISTATTSALPGKLRLLGVALGLPWFNPIPLMNDNRAVFGVNLGHLWHESDKVGQWMATLLAGVEAGWVRPHVDRRFPLEQAGAAQAHLEARRNIGKVVLET